MWISQYFEQLSSAFCVSSHRASLLIGLIRRGSRIYINLHDRFVRFDFTLSTALRSRNVFVVFNKSRSIVILNRDYILAVRRFSYRCILDVIAVCITLIKVENFYWKNRVFY